MLRELFNGRKGEVFNGKNVLETNKSCKMLPPNFPALFFKYSVTRRTHLTMEYISEISIIQITYSTSCSRTMVITYYSWQTERQTDSDGCCQNV